MIREAFVLGVEKGDGERRVSFSFLPIKLRMEQREIPS
jgi:hypothetical protein